jgi:hypothetical protein
MKRYLTAEIAEQKIHGNKYEAYNRKVRLIWQNVVLTAIKLCERQKKPDFGELVSSELNVEDSRAVIARNESDVPAS